MAARDLASRLTRRVLLQQPDLIPNGKGGRTPNPLNEGWADVAKPWAEIVALRGDEALKLGVERRTQLWRLTIRRRDDVTPGHRIIWKGVTIDIKSAAPNAEGDATVITGESGAKG